MVNKIANFISYFRQIGHFIFFECCVGHDLFFCRLMHCHLICARLGRMWRRRRLEQNLNRRHQLVRNQIIMGLVVFGVGNQMKSTRFKWWQMKRMAPLGGCRWSVIIKLKLPSHVVHLKKERTIDGGGGFYFISISFRTQYYIFRCIWETCDGWTEEAKTCPDPFSVRKAFNIFVLIKKIQTGC